MRRIKYKNNNNNKNKMKKKILPKHCLSKLPML